MGSLEPAGPLLNALSVVHGGAHRVFRAPFQRLHPPSRAPGLRGRLPRDGSAVDAMAVVNGRFFNRFASLPRQGLVPVRQVLLRPERLGRQRPRRPPLQPAHPLPRAPGATPHRACKTHCFELRRKSALFRNSALFSKEHTFRNYCAFCKDCAFSPAPARCLMLLKCHVANA